MFFRQPHWQKLLTATYIYVALGFHKRSAEQLQKHEPRRGKLLRHKLVVEFWSFFAKKPMATRFWERRFEDIYNEYEYFPRHGLKTAKGLCSNDTIFLTPP